MGGGQFISSSHGISAAASSSERIVFSLSPSWGHSHGRQSFINFSSVFPMSFSSSRTAPVWVPVSGVWSFRNRLLQVGSPVGSQVLPINLSQLGCLSPQVHGSSQEPAPSWASHGFRASFSHSPAPLWDPPGWISAPPQTPCAAEAQLLHRGPHPRLQGNLCWVTWSTSCPSFSTDMGICRAVPLAYSHSSLL